MNYSVAKDMEMLERNFVRRLVSYIASVDAEDEINFEEHDRRYHGGKYDPVTMTCEMRNANEKGDLYDVLSAEMEEHEQRQKLIRDNPDLMTDEEFLNYFGKSKKSQRRLAKWLKRITSAKPDGGGQQIGTLNGMAVYAHDEFYSEYAYSQNARFTITHNKPLWQRKALEARNLGDLLKKVYKTEETAENAHAVTRHRKWQIARGFYYGHISLEGTPCYLVLTRTEDNRLLLYDFIVGKKRGQVAPI